MQNKNRVTGNITKDKLIELVKSDEIDTIIIM